MVTEVKQVEMEDEEKSNSNLSYVEGFYVY